MAIQPGSNYKRHRRDLLSHVSSVHFSRVAQPNPQRRTATARNRIA